MVADMKLNKSGKSNKVIPNCISCIHVHPHSGPISFVIPKPKNKIISRAATNPAPDQYDACFCGNPVAERFAVLQSVSYSCKDHEYQDSVSENRRVSREELIASIEERKKPHK